tara:strand:+ start:237 stop:509 length:273 start_codon:yes stop_codon:yes gene_type:complete
MVYAPTYAIRMIAADAEAAGNWIVKSPFVDVFVPPKSITHIALFDAEELYMIQPSADIVAEANTSSVKSTIAVVPDTEIAAPSRFCPPDE